MKNAGYQLKKIRRLNAALHRDLGYFFSVLVIGYCISGLALNHIDDWNPDFIIRKTEVTLDRPYSRAEVDGEAIAAFGKLVGEDGYKVFDFPTDHQVKIYYEDASLLVDLERGRGVYESVRRRPLFYQANVLHRNTLNGWKWAADVFAVLLIVINITGLFVLKGKYGLSKRGKWLILAGTLPVVIAIILHSLS